MKRAIHKLWIRGSVRQLHGVEVCLGRYLALLVAVAGVTAIFWPSRDLLAARWGYALALAILVPIFEPWHRELYLSMDSPVLRMRRVVIGVVPLGSSDYELEGRCLAVERRTVEDVVNENSPIGCLLVFLPFPLGAIFSGMGKPKNRLVHKTQWALCLRGVGAGTEDLARLANEAVAVPFLEAVEEIQPGHVERA